MAGPDTIRGIAFQHAYAIQLALDVIEDPDAAALTIEGAADIVDVELARKAAPRRPIFQIKARQEPYDWPPGEIAGVIRAWQQAGGGVDAPLRFVSDGPASPETARRLKPALESARIGQLQDDERAYLAVHGIDAATAAYVELATRGDRTGALLAMAESRLRRMLALGGPVAEEAPVSAVDHLFRLFAVEGGEQHIERRTFTRAELAAALDVDLALLDGGEGWSDATAAAYRAAVTAGRAPHPLVELAALLDPTAVTPALALTVTANEADDGTQRLTTSLVDDHGGAAVCGPAGAGKTTSARQMAAHAAQQDRTAIIVASAGYRRGDLDRRIHRILEEAVGQSLAPGAVAAALAEPKATLIVDGLAGLSVEQEDAIAADLRDAMERFPQLRLVFTARERAFPRRFALPTFTLSLLGTQERTTIASGLVADPSGTVADLESNLGNVVDNPLLFVMALALTRVGVAATGRAQIFAGFIDGLRERATETTVDEADLAALRLAAAALVGKGRFAADRYWWFATLAEALSQLRAAGIYDVSERSAEAVFRRLQTIGLLFEDEIVASVSLLHDAFRDYLASVALARQEVDLPRPVTAEWESAVELVAEQGGLTPDHARAIVDDNAVAATRAGRFTKGGADAALTGELARALTVGHLGSAPIGTGFGVVVASGDAHRYAMVVADAGDEEMTLKAAEGIAGAAAFAVAVDRDAGPLALAAALWREFLNKLTAAELPSLMCPVPETAAELAEAISVRFVERRAELEAVAVRLVPTLADRIVSGVGWSGLRAHVGEAETATLLPGQQWTFHPLRYSFGGDDVVVTAAPDAPPDGEFRGQAVAEMFVDSAPRDEALSALVGELSRLLPEIP